MKKFPDWFFNQSDWQEKTLGEVAEINPSNSELPKKFYYIDLESVFKGSLTKNILLEKNSAPSRAQRILKADDVIFQMVRPYQQNNYFFENEKDFPTVASTGYAQLRAKEKILPKFLYFCLYENNFVNQVLFRCVGGTYPAINAEDLSQCKIKFPPLAEQKQIAEYFTHLDNAINAQETKLKSWREVKKAMLQKIFAQEYFFTQDNGDKFPAWQEKTLGEVAEITSSKRIFVSEYVSEGVPFIRGQEISDNSISSSEKFNCYISEERYNEIKNQYGVPQKNDILITAVGTIGNLYLVEEDKKFYFKDGNIIWIKNFNQSIAPNYLKIFMQSFDFRNQILNFAMGGAQKALTIEKLFNAKIKIPCLEEQKKIAEYFSSLDRIIDAENKMLENLRLMKKGLLQKLFV